ncbi:Hypothetical protein SRAE_X000041700 [Strongyloides ratti]|uniref:Tc1-like transposase DDE domain-containing protein n=1 Tax=Strongyloides ratti TaxID=34506 RepID=A0A090LMM1_STRRB|nr:Hypothetical protein SRAE_X000041700 [Strongyloides ratti]CEF71090.1 Hypothetical protein SRAE_X000041700 [Strongyloides ratti]
MPNDSEKKRIIDRIQAITFYKKNPLDCFTDFSNRGRPSILTQDSREIIQQSLQKQNKSCRELSKEILIKNNISISKDTINRFLKKNNKASKVVDNSLNTQINKEDILFLAMQVKSFNNNNFMQFVFSDEFFIYILKETKNKSERICINEINDIDTSKKLKLVQKNSICIGIFLMFTGKRLMWMITENDQKWDGDFFRNVILLENVIPFLNNSNNVFNKNEIVFVHDRSSWMKANATQYFLKNHNINFWGNDTWPEDSPDLNPAKTFREILKNKMELLINKGEKFCQNSIEDLKIRLKKVLKELEYDQILFQNLLLSMSELFRQIRENNDGITI